MTLAGFRWSHNKGQAVLLRLLRRVANPPVADCKYLRPIAGDATECARGCAAAARCVSTADPRCLRQLLCRNRRICGRVFGSIVARLVQRARRLRAVAESDLVWQI